jgi:colanic acid/amylovoran biosynthesis glycosyltransferase
MKIAYINGGLSISETFIYDTVKGLSDKFEVTFFLGTEPFYKEGFNFLVNNYLLSEKLKWIIRNTFPKRGSKILWKLQCSKMKRLLYPKIKHFDLIFIEYGTTAVNLIPLLNLANKPFIVHFHGFDITSTLKDPYYRNGLKFVFQKAKNIIAASNHIRRLLVLEGCPERKIHIIRHGIDHSKFARPENNSSNQIPSLVFVGRLTDKKNPIATIQAFKIVQESFSNCILHMVGSGPLLKRCKELVSDLDLKEKVIFHGVKLNNAAIQLMKEADIYVQHSVTALSGDQEGFGMSLAEAAALGKPVVSTLHNGIPENVIDGVTGYLVPEFNYEMMAERIKELLNDSEKARRMGKAGREHILSLCDPVKRINKIAELINSF